MILCKAGEKMLLAVLNSSVISPITFNSTTIGNKISIFY